MKSGFVIPHLAPSEFPLCTLVSEGVLEALETRGCCSVITDAHELATSSLCYSRHGRNPDNSVCQLTFSVLQFLIH